ncbi:MAG: C40 family peptidase [Nesterenkonia sp.]
MPNENTYASRRDRRRATRKGTFGLNAATAGRASATALTTLGLVLTSTVAAQASADGPEQDRQSAAVQLDTAGFSADHGSHSANEAPAAQQADARPTQQPAQPSEHQAGDGFTTASSTGVSETSPSSDSSNSVVAAAYSAIGTPYSWGGTTPAAFDCSGLINWAYQQAGHDGLPRTTFGMEMSLPQVSAPQPGDIVLANNSTHAGIYVGDGQVISATSSGVSLHNMHEEWHQVNAIVSPN